MTLNIPETRQDLLIARLRTGTTIVAAEAAAEFGVSIDTIRRDIIALEHAGRARRVRGGAVPVMPPAPPLQDRLAASNSAIPAIADRARAHLADVTTLVLDGGSTVLALAERLTPVPGRLVITPSPWVAVACQQNGVEVFMIGGVLSPSGGINTGEDALLRLAGTRADVAVLGACGLDPDFGLSADEPAEARLKQAMADMAGQCVILADQGKMGLNSRFRALPPERIDLVITDRAGPQDAGFTRSGVEVAYA